MSKVEQLRQQISLFDEQYELGNPLITDTEYEKKYSKLQKMEAETGDISPDSPTQRITYLKVPGRETVKHPIPMLSLDKANDYVQLKKWFVSIFKEVLAQFKLDGLTIVLRYINGQLVDAVTRGDGYEGYRVLHTVLTVRNLPKEIPFKGELEIRGEVYVPFKDFERVNNALPLDQRYANSRALAAGTVQMLDANIAAERGLEIQVFDLIRAEGKEFNSDSDALGFLENQGFPVVETISFTDFHRLTSYLVKVEKQVRPELPFPIDGIVVKANDLSVREQLGYTSKHPKWGIAFKFESQEVFTNLTDIIVQIGKSGQVTPVAVFDPIEIGGVTITRATLHNPEFVWTNDIRVGDRIVIARANDVIPRVMKSFPEQRKEDLPVWKLLKFCPVCNSPIELRGPLAFCTGEECPAQLVEQLIHYCSRDALDIEGLGNSNVKLFFEMGFVKTPADLYSLESKAGEIMELEGFGNKKLDKILESIENTKNQPFSRSLYAINIPYLGRANSRILAAKFLNIDALMGATREQLLQIEGIGDVTADTIIEFFSKEKNQTLIACLKDAGVTMMEEAPVAISDELPLTGKTIVITGTLSMKRAEIEDIIRANGGKPSGSVSKNTDFLILGPDKNGTTKHKKALSLGVPIISELELMDILENNSKGLHNPYFVGRGQD
ncbi:NAD-dependent DNA ligase LigA [Bacteroides sp.]|uniref:NAD-dependent DNA ligase LigA n=1 Tax=Bacteroides sp. TaxID=29523 RepID=UPI00260D1C6A|nr:NAD-dependent DNA ligase LigA [Bacteroides sp.]MDD3040419.1 NAD-dependent DNA ligase LigA [Bacteroides sp.]